MLVSSSEGFLRESLFAAILLRALMIAFELGFVREVGRFKSSRFNVPHKKFWTIARLIFQCALYIC